MADVDFTIDPAETKLSHIWRTSIQTTVKGVEKRSALFTWPRIKLNNTYEFPTDSKYNWIRRNLIFNSDGLWSIPIWQDATELSSSAASGQKILNVNETSNRHFYNSREVVLVSPTDYTSYEVGVISSFTSNQITLTENLSGTWGAGTFVVPYYTFRIPPSQTLRSELQHYQILEIEANEAYETSRSFTYSVPASGADQYLGKDLFLTCFLLPVTYEFSRPYEYQQFLGLGYPYPNYAAGDNKINLKSVLPLDTRTKIKEFLNFFDNKMGRLLPFWVPSWNKDIVITGAVGPADVQITINPIDYSNTYLNNDINGRHVFFFFPDGTYRCRKILSSTSDTITLDNSLAAEITSDMVDDMVISFLYFCRFDLDEVELNYPLNNPASAKAEVSFSVLIGEEYT
jgi:hypothetical protein